jgi:hypothetical protein
MVANRTSAVVFCALASVFFAGVAHAHAGDHGPQSGGGGAASGGGAAGAGAGSGATATTDATGPATPDKGAQPEPLYLGIDVVVGFGTYMTVLETPPLTNQVLGGNGLFKVGHRTATFVLEGRYDFKTFGLGVRFPIIAGRVYDNASPLAFGDSNFATGGLELSLDMAKKLSKTVEAIPYLALVAPTQTGTALPTAAALAAAGSGFDHFSAQKYSEGIAAAYAHGGEDNALYLNHRIGIVPGVKLKLQFGNTDLQPFLKIPFMIAVQDSTQEPLRVEAVGGFRLAQNVGPVAFGVRLYGNVPITQKTGMTDPLLVVEPEIRFQLTPSSAFYVSGIIPLAGAVSAFDDPSNGAVRAGINATF